MLESAIGGIAVPLFEQLWKAGGHLAKQVGQARQDVSDIEKILKASKEYQQKYENRHGQVKIMPGLMKEPVPLASIYTTVQFLDEYSIRQFASLDELEQLYRDQDKRRFQANGKRHDGITIAKEKQYLMVLGGPGVGKSTFLRKLGLEALKGQQGELQHNQIPVFIELKTFRSKTIDLNTIIDNEFKICGFPDAQAFTELSLKQGKLLVLLDGLDEVPTDNVNQVIEHIEAFTTQHDKNTFVASCRTAAYRSSFKQFTDVTIADFSNGQIKQFIQRWFHSELDQEADTANQYWQLLKRPENQAAKELAQTPLLLTFLCLIYERKQMLPNQRSTLYENALDLLLSEWSAQKRLKLTPIYQGFHPKLEKDLLSEIAYTSFEEDRLFFSKADITDRITTYLADTLDASEYLDGQAILQEIEVQQGILVERATNTYSFSHLTLQEYLTALYIVNNQLISKLVSQHLTDQRWHEVFLLVIGLMGRRGHKLLEAIDQQARENLQARPKIQSLVRWAYQITQGPPTNYEDFGKIVIAIDVASEIAKVITKDSDIHTFRASYITKVSNIHKTITQDIVNDIAKSLEDSTNSYMTEVKTRNINRDGDGKENINREGEGVIISEGAKKLAEAIRRRRYKPKPITRDNSIEKFVEDKASKIVEDIAKNIAKVIACTGDSSIASNSDKARDSANHLIRYKIMNTPAAQELPKQLFILKNKMSQLSASSDEWDRYANELRTAFLSALELAFENILFSTEEWQCLNDYLYANELLLKCQQASIGISRKTWESLKERLLTV